MRRMKMSKSSRMNKSKTAVKRTTKHSAKASHPMMTLDKMVMDFRSMPAKLADHCRKDLTTLTQQQNKLKSELQKTQSQMNMAKNKHAMLSKSKTKTAATKKNAMTAQKAYNQ